MARPWYDMHDCGDRYAAAVGLTPFPSRLASPATACLCAPLPPCFFLAHRVFPSYLAVTPMPHGGWHAGAWSRASAAGGRAGRRGGAALATRAAATSAPRRQRRETCGTLTTAATGARSSPSAAMMEDGRAPHRSRAPRRAPATMSALLVCATTCSTAAARHLFMGYHPCCPRPTHPSLAAGCYSSASVRVCSTAIYYAQKVILSHLHPLSGIYGGV